jgi:hypothetical protein
MASVAHAVALAPMAGASRATPGRSSSVAKSLRANTRANARSVGGNTVRETQAHVLVSGALESASGDPRAANPQLPRQRNLRSAHADAPARPSTADQGR